MRAAAGGGTQRIAAAVRPRCAVVAVVTARVRGAQEGTVKVAAVSAQAACRCAGRYRVQSNMRSAQRQAVAAGRQAGQWRAADAKIVRAAW